MPIEQSRSPEEFSAFERSGWDANIGGYNSAFGMVSRQTVGPMLDAAHVTRGMQVLDICCGPGMLAAGALERGAEPIGFDLSEEAVQLARTLVPQGRFQQGDAQALPFPAESFRCGALWLRAHAFARTRGGTPRDTARAATWWAGIIQCLGCDRGRLHLGL